MFRNKSVSVHQFAMIPSADIPRSAFKRESALKTTFDSGKLVPIFVDEILPGDTHSLEMTSFCRMATPVYPLMDNLHFETFFFFVPMRLVWNNFQKFMGEQANPGDSISYLVPTASSPAGGYAVNSLQDYFGLPTVGQVGGGNTVAHNNLPLRAYNLIYNEWFRDENLINSVTVDKGDGPDTAANYVLLSRGKRYDYFTGCLPWPQKGNTSVSLPLGTSAPIVGLSVGTSVSQAIASQQPVNGALPSGANSMSGASYTFAMSKSAPGTAAATAFNSTNSLLYADLSAATAATINQLRQSFQIQKLLERDARGGTRYTELVRAHFGVTPPDFRLQRPEFLGGGSSVINITPIAQTSGTSASGTTTPLGNLAAMGSGVAIGHGFRQSFTEHGYIIGLANVRADLAYQQGLRKLWSRSTRYDFYFPEFAALGEQAVLNKEIYCDGSVNDNNVFGYQERWGEYRYFPSLTTGLFRSTSAGTLDAWHLAQKFTSLPTLNSTFITDTPPVSRVVAVPSQPQFLLDAVFKIVSVRPMPMYSVPGLIDHF